ncbi:MAG TPA: nucleotidyltransferase domain-containing protein [Ignavibacteria bacterium]|nr:nucleotidyltransferase domain-containing protein [Ignavibacteria bacterium]
MGKDEVINKVRNYKKLLKEHFDLDSVYLFGSHLKGNAKEDSDIDVAIIVNKLQGDYFSTIPVAWKLRSQIDNRIEPMVFEKGRDESGFLEEILNTGIEIE